MKGKKTLFWIKVLLMGFVVLITIVIFGGVIIYRLLPSPAGRTNFLIMGVSGKNSGGGDLTDMMMFVSVDPPSGQVVLLSLPRDIWLPALRAKLNSVYHYRGLLETKKVVGEITGQPVDYAFIIDFDIFKKLIDILGGVEVEVEQSFDDYWYPIEGRENDLCDGDPLYRCRYEHLHFDAGKQLMSGEIALKYVRSRRAEGNEGTDFARERRQQRLLAAVKNKIISLDFWLVPDRPRELYLALTANIKTDLPREKFLDFLRMGLWARKATLAYGSLDELLFNPPISYRYDEQWVLIPKKGNWDEVHLYLNNLFLN